MLNFSSRLVGQVQVNDNKEVIFSLLQFHSPLNSLQGPLVKNLGPCFPWLFSQEEGCVTCPMTLGKEARPSQLRSALPLAGFFLFHAACLNNAFLPATLCPAEWPAPTRGTAVLNCVRHYVGKSIPLRGHCSQPFVVVLSGSIQFLSEIKLLEAAQCLPPLWTSHWIPRQLEGVTEGHILWRQTAWGRPTWDFVKAMGFLVSVFPFVKWDDNRTYPILLYENVRIYPHKGLRKILRRGCMLSKR